MTLPLAGYTGGPSRKCTSHLGAEVSKKPGFLDLDLLLAHARTFDTRGQREGMISSAGHRGAGQGTVGNPALFLPETPLPEKHVFGSWENVLVQRKQ